MALSTISGTTGITDATITSAKLADFAAAVDLNGVELVLDADADTSITADTDDRIDFKIAGVEHFSFSNSSGDTIIKPMVDAKDIIFQQYDGNKILEINDGNFVGIGGNATAAGEIRIYEDTDNGSHYTGFKAGNNTASVAYVLPTADGTSGFALTTDGSGTLSWSSVSSAADDISAGDGAVTISTTSGNITIDATANDTDIIFKGTDNSSDITMLTLDGSDAGTAIFNHDIKIADDGQVGSASAADAMIISSGGIVTFKDDILIKDGGTIGSASDADAIAIGSDGDVTLTQDLELQHDGAILSFGANDEIALTHVHDTGLLLTDSGGTPTLQLHDANESIASDGSKVIITSGGTAFSLPTADGSANQVLTTNGSGVLSFATASSADPSSADGDSLGTASAEWSDLYLADGGIVYFGNDQDIRLTHNADKGLILKHSATADDKPIVLTLQTGETDMAADDVIGKIEFQAPDEGTGTDAVLVAAAIQARAEGDFSSSSNATSLEFMTGSSEAAAAKMTINSDGEVGIGTTNPTSKLHISDNANYSLKVVKSGSNIHAANFASNGTAALGIVVDESNNQVRLNSEGANDSFILEVADGTDGVIIDSAGHVTKPLNPAFRVYQSTATDYANNHTMYNQNITEDYDVNADMGTNGSFTAPVTGKYLFTMSLYDDGAGGGDQYDMCFVTSNRSYRWGNRMEYEANVTGYGNVAKVEGVIIADMDANDTAYVKFCGGQTTTNSANSEHAYYSGILIG